MLKPSFLFLVSNGPITYIFAGVLVLTFLFRWNKIAVETKNRYDRHINNCVEMQNMINYYIVILSKQPEKFVSTVYAIPQCMNVPLKPIIFGADSIQIFLRSSGDQSAYTNSIMRLLNQIKHDDLAMVRFFMKWMQVWPEDEDTWWRKLYFISYVGSCAVGTLLEILFVITEARTADPLTLLQILTDAIATGSFVYKAVYVRHHAKAILKLSDVLLDEFTPLEKDHVPVKIKVSKAAWIPSLAHFGLIVTSTVTCVASAWQPPEVRQLTFRAPPFWNVNPYTFYPVYVLLVWCHIGIFPSNSSLDAIVICLSNLLREKAQTLQIIIRDLDRVKDKEQRDAELNKIIKYHTMFINVYQQTERLTNKPMLIQITFHVVGVGTPTLRLLLGASDFDIAYGMFLIFYIFWVISSMLVYFLMCDAATASVQRIQFVTYSAYHPCMTKDQVGKLCVVMATVQRPMYLTARKLIKMDRRTMLQLLKRSYSIYSAVLKTRK